MEQGHIPDEKWTERPRKVSREDLSEDRAIQISLCAGAQTMKTILEFRMLLMVYVKRNSELGSDDER